MTNIIANVVLHHYSWAGFGRKAAAPAKKLGKNAKVLMRMSVQVTCPFYHDPQLKEGACVPFVVAILVPC